MDNILLIDGHNALHRANISFGDAKLKHVIAAPGEQYCFCGQHWNCDTNSCPDDFTMVFNFFRNLRPIIEKFAPDKCIFCLEGHPQFRYDLYKDYKSNRIIKNASRKEANLKFKYDCEIVLPLLQLLPITVARAVNYECDDLIGALCENMKEENLTVLSNDSDFIQLLQKGYRDCNIYNPIKKVMMEAPAYPYVTWKCLNGDKSDSIPALLKPKKALDAVNNPELFKKFMDVEENRANFSINRQLIEFHQVPLEEIVFEEGYRKFDLLREQFQIMRFESMINDLSWEKYTTTFDCLKY